MTQRFGRNKRRAARLRIVELEQHLSASMYAKEQVQKALHTARYREANALQLALESVMAKEPHIQRAMERIGDSLGAQLGPQLRPIAEKLLAQGGSRRMGGPVSFSARIDSHTAQKPVEILRGEIHLDYNVVLDR